MQLMQFLNNRGMQLVRFGVDNSGRNSYTWSGHLGTQLIHFLDPGTQLILPPSSGCWGRGQHPHVEGSLVCVQTVDRGIV